MVVLPLDLPFRQCPIVGKPRRTCDFRKVRRLFVVGVEAYFMADDHDEKDALQRDICLIGGLFTAVID